MIIINKSPVNK